MSVLDSATFIKIIRGDYYNTESEYNQYYISTDSLSEIHVCIDNVTISGKLTIESNISYPFYIKIENTSFLGRIDINDGIFDKGISFRAVHFRDRVYFNGGKFLWIHFAKSKFDNLFAFGGGGGFGNFGSVTISDVTANSFGAYGGQYKSLSFQGKGAKYIGVYNDGTFVNSLSFSNVLEDSTISIHNVAINRLFFSGRYYEKNTIDIENVKINTIRFNSFRNMGSLVFNNITVNKTNQKISNMTISEFFRLKNISEQQKSIFQSYTPIVIDESLPLYKLHLTLDDPYLNEKQQLLLTNENEIQNSLFEMDKVTLGDFEMKNVEMEKFMKISIINTDLSTIKLFNSSFPYKKVKGNNKALYEVFNDLYTVSIKQNNKRDQIEYYKASKSALFRSLFNRNWYRNIPSIISLGLSFIYSNFGTRWTQAFFLMTPVFGALFFCLMLLDSKYCFDFSSNGFVHFRQLLVYYVRFLNPTHSLEFMDSIFINYKFSENLFFVIFDTFGRIFVGIGLFETVQSFRNYVRK